MIQNQNTGTPDVVLPESMSATLGALLCDNGFVLCGNQFGAEFQHPRLSVRRA